MVSDDENQAGVSHISVKPRPFYKGSPSVWFRQIESQFTYAKITKSETKYHHVVSALPEEIAVSIDLECEVDYEKLKETVLGSLKPSQHELIDQALRGLELGNKRPTQMVGEIRRRFSDIGLKVDEKIVKSQILTALPHAIRSALVGHENSTLDDFSKIADSMLSITTSNLADPFSIAAVDMANNMFDGRHRGSWRTDYRQPPFRRTEDRQVDGKSKLSVRPFYIGQIPRVCNAHIFYCEHAWSCRRWCKWPNKHQHILRDNEKTPRHSRSNSSVPPSDLNK